jgi:hypothetical protein
VTALLESEAEARALPGVRAVYAAYDLAGWQQHWLSACQAMLTEACGDIPLGGYEREVLMDLGGQPERLAAVLAVIRRARETGTTAREDGTDE